MDKDLSILGLRTCIYLVNDIDVAKEWYAKAFEVEPYFEEPFYVGFDVGGFELGLQPQKESGQKIQSVRTYWGVEDIQVQYERLLKLGATIDEAPHSVGDPIMVASVMDPWGNFIGLIFNPLFKKQ